MMSLRFLLLLVLLVVATTFAQDECNCDGAIEAAKAEANKENQGISNQVATAEAQIKASQNELNGCKAKVTEITQAHATQQAGFQTKIDALTKEKATLEATSDKLELLQKELDENKAVLEKTKKSSEQAEAQLKTEMEAERKLLKEAEGALVGTQKELVGAQEEIESLKKAKASTYFNFGALSDDIMGLFGKEKGKSEL